MSMSSRKVMAGAVVLLLGLAGCQPASASVSPTAAPSSASVSSAPESVAPGASTETSPPAAAGQSDTAWGRIWDSLPAGFPTYPGATPAEEAATGPASAVLAVPGTDARAIAGWMQSKLEQATYSTEALSGPLEDGSYVLDSTGAGPGCRVQVSVAPLGGLTTVTVLYGASCPKPWTRAEPDHSMNPRASDFLGAAVLAVVLFALVAILVLGNIPHGWHDALPIRNAVWEDAAYAGVEPAGISGSVLLLGVQIVQTAQPRDVAALALVVGLFLVLLIVAVMLGSPMR